MSSEIEAFRRQLVDKLATTAAKRPNSATRRDWYLALSLMLRDQLALDWIETKRRQIDTDVKLVYYLSMEFLIGRSLRNALINLGLMEVCASALEGLGLSLEELAEVEDEAGLGNGGLGRLAACFLDSMATLDVPGRGYGIRYEFGIFRQHIESGRQVERPDNWLRYGNPWELPRPEVLFPIHFGGSVREVRNPQGRLGHVWSGGERVMAMAYDLPIPGFGRAAVSSVRLWAAKAARELDLIQFNRGDYLAAVREKDESEGISKVLYPDDSTTQGRELRFKQQYFFVSASLQDILARYKANHSDLRLLGDKIAIQLNDTHPSVAVVELMRLLIDEEGLDWDTAFSICGQVFGYTNHTLLPEALERWPVWLFERHLPRHLQIIYDINARFLDGVRARYPGDDALIRRVSLVDEYGERSVRMAHLAFVGSRVVNGVSAMHTELLRETVFRDFSRLYPERIVNVTNGVTPRRWLWQANPPLREVIRAHLGDGWVTDLDRLEALGALVDDPDLIRDVLAAKRASKIALAGYVQQAIGQTLDPGSLFDVQVKRIHEYKRQLLNVLHVMSLYGRLLQGEAIGPARTVIFAGKAAPGYRLAKLSIRFILALAATLERDSAVGGRLKVIFLPNYDVSLAERIFPAADLSEQISTAGFEASGTGNMKSMLNAAVMIATQDGANVEIDAASGGRANFVFGVDADEVARRRGEWVDFHAFLSAHPALHLGLNRVLEGLDSGDKEDLSELVGHLGSGADPYFVIRDFDAYAACQQEVSATFADPSAWGGRAIRNLADCGRFSSDRSIREYAERIWRL